MFINDNSEFNGRKLIGVMVIYGVLGLILYFS